MKKLLFLAIFSLVSVLTMNAYDDDNIESVVYYSISTGLEIDLPKEDCIEVTTYKNGNVSSKKVLGRDNNADIGALIIRIDSYKRDLYLCNHFSHRKNEIPGIKKRIDETFIKIADRITGTKGLVDHIEFAQKDESYKYGSNTKYYKTMRFYIYFKDGTRGIYTLEPFIGKKH